MSKNSSQKMKILFLMKILLEKTDEENPLTMNEILSYLAEYDIVAERKSIYDDMEALRQFGIDVISRKRKTTEYFVGSRLFELAELKLLVDSVECSRFITHKKSSDLIGKISNLASEEQSKSLRRQVFVQNRIKNMNESIYYNVDAIHTAIGENKKISFKYFEFTLDKEKEFRKNGDSYIQSPYGVSWDDENYYLITYSEKYQDFVHYRVDRMTQLEVLDEPREKIPDNQYFDIADYHKKFFHMFTGDEQILKLKFDASLINVVIDRFGNDVCIEKSDEHHFCVKAQVAVSSTFFGWLFQFQDKVQIVSPKKVQQTYITYLEQTLKNYQDISDFCD